MAKQLQIRGGTTAQHSTFTGAVREITVDTDKDVVVVHDGSTAGGFPLAKQTSVDAKVDKVTSTDNAIVRFDGTTGVVQNSGVVIYDNNTLIIGPNVSTGNKYISIIPSDFSIQATEFNVAYRALQLNPSGGNLLIGTTTDNGVDKLQVNGTISSGPIPETSVDVNTLKLITRTYVINNTSPNIPIADYGYLEVIVHSSGLWAMQRFTCLGAYDSYAGRTFVRCFISGTTWTAWAEK